MDVVTWLVWALLGTAAGTATGIVPGLHVNTLAALGAALLPIGPHVAVALVAAGTVHTFLGILPATYLGLPDEDAPVAVLPAHRMLAEGQAPTAVRLSLHASLLAALGACLAVPMYALALRHALLLRVLDAATPWILAALIIYLLVSEQDLRRMLRAALVVLLAGILGWWAPRIATTSFLPGASSPLLPLLGGLFGSAGLLVALQHRADVPPQRGSRPPRRTTGPVLRGLAASAWTALLPGVTSATATAVAAPRGDDPRRTLATLSAVDTAHAILALSVLWVLLRGRTGLALAVQDMLAVHAWSQGVPPRALAWILAAVVLAAALAVAAGTALEPLYRRAVLAMAPGWASLAALAMLLGLTAALTGVSGLVILAASTAVGLLPLMWGIRRIHLTACLTIPVLLRALSA